MDNESWNQFISRFRDSIIAENLYVEDVDDDTVELTAHCFVNGSQISYSFPLELISNYKQRFTSFIFSMAKQIQATDKLEKECASLQMQLQKVLIYFLISMQKN